MGLIINKELYENLKNKSRLSNVDVSQNLVTGSYYTFFKNFLFEIRYDNKIYVYENYGTKGEPVLVLDFFKNDLDHDQIQDVFVYDNLLLITSKNGFYRAFMDQLEDNVNDPSGSYKYQNNFYELNSSLRYRPYSIFNDILAIKDDTDKIQLIEIKKDNTKTSVTLDKNIEGFTLLNETRLVITFYNEPYYMYLYDTTTNKIVQTFKLNENINEYDYDINYQITRLFNFKGYIYFTTRLGQIYTIKISFNHLDNNKVAKPFYQMGSNIDYIKSINDYIIFMDRTNNTLVYNTVHDRKEIIKNNHLIKSLALSDFIMIISLYDSVDEDYKKRIINSGVIPEDVKLNEIKKLIIYNPPNIRILNEKLEYYFDQEEDPLVYINLNIELSENKINNFDSSSYRVKLNITDSSGKNLINESDNKLFSKPGIISNMYIKVGRKSEYIDNNKLFKLLENGEFKYKFTLDNLDTKVTFFNEFYPNVTKDLYEELTDLNHENKEIPNKNYFDGFEDSTKIKDIFHNNDNEKVITLLSNLVNEKYIPTNSKLNIDSSDMYLDYPDYNPKNYIDLSNNYPNNQIENNVINSDVYFNGYKLFKSDTLQKDNFDGSVNLYVNHNSLRKFISEDMYSNMIKNKSLLTNNFIISNKSRSLYETEKLMISHTVSNDFENQTSLLPTKGILLRNSRVKNFKIQNIRVYVKINNENEEGNKYYHRLNPRNYNLWIDKNYKMLRVAIFGLQIPEGSTIMVMDNGLTNNVILYNKLNYIKRDIDSLPIVEIGPKGELLTELDRRTEDIEVIVDGLTLVPNVDFFVMNTPHDPDIPSMVAFKNVIPNTSKVEITLLNENSNNVYFFPEPAIGTENVFVLPDDKRVFTSYRDENKKEIFNFEIFSNNRKLSNDLIEIENSKAIKIKSSRSVLKNVMVRFNFSYNEILQQVIDNYKYKNINVNENRYHDYSVKYKNNFDIATKNKQAKTLGNLLIIQLINSGKNILDCNSKDLPIDVNLNTDIIENSYIRKNINLDMNRTNLIKNINKVSDYINEIIDVNKNNDNLLLHSNNPSWYIENERNLLRNSRDIALKPNSSGSGISNQLSNKSWKIETNDNSIISMYYWIQHTNGYAGQDIIEKLIKNMDYTFSIDVKPDKDLKIIIGTSSRVLEKPGYKTYELKKDEWKRINYTFKWIGNLDDVLPMSFRNNDDNVGITMYYDNIKLEKFINENPTFSYAPEDKKVSQFPYSKSDKYSDYFNQKENIKDVRILSKENLKLNFDIDESILERNELYTFSFYARNKNKKETKFINENLDINFDIKNDEFKPYVDYIYIDNKMNISRELSRSYIKQDGKNKDFNLDLFGFKLEKGLKRTQYLPNMKDIQELDLISNTFNIDYKNGSNLLQLDKDFTINLQKSLGSLSGNNILENSERIIKYTKDSEDISTIEFTTNENLLPNTTYTISNKLNLINIRKGERGEVYFSIKVTYDDDHVRYYTSRYKMGENETNYNGTISFTFTTENMRIKSIDYIRFMPTFIEFDYLEAKNFQLEKSYEVTDWGLTWEELTKKFNYDIQRDLYYKNYISSKNIIEYYDLNKMSATSYNNTKKMNEKFELTGMPIWKHQTYKYSSAPYSLYYDFKKQSNTIIFQPGESKTFSIYYKLEFGNAENSDNISLKWYDSKLRKSYDTVYTTKERYQGGWERIKTTFINDTDEKMEISPLMYGTKYPENITYFSSYQIEEGKEMTEFEKPLNIKQQERIREIISIKKENNTEGIISADLIDQSTIDKNSFYTLSMNVKIESLGDITTKNLYAGYVMKDGQILSSNNIFYIPLDKIEEEFKAYFIFYIRDFNEIDKFIIRSGYSQEQSANNIMSFSKFKLEKGKIATPYSSNTNIISTNLLIDPEI